MFLVVVGWVPASLGQFLGPLVQTLRHKPDLCYCAPVLAVTLPSALLITAWNYLASQTSSCPSTIVAIVKLAKMFPFMIFQSFHSWLFPNHPDLLEKTTQAEPLSFD